MMNEHLKNLLDYLDKLSKVQHAGHYVNDEIKEVVKAIRIELGLEESKKKTVEDSKRMLFHAKLKQLGHEPNFLNDTIFNAVVHSKELDIQIPYLRGTGATTTGVLLAKMFPSVLFITTPAIALREGHERVVSLPGRAFELDKGIIIVDSGIVIEGELEDSVRVIELLEVE